MEIPAKIVDVDWRGITFEIAGHKVSFSVSLSAWTYRFMVSLDTYTFYLSSAESVERFIERIHEGNPIFIHYVGIISIMTLEPRNRYLNLALKKDLDEPLVYRAVKAVYVSLTHRFSMSWAMADYSKIKDSLDFLISHFDSDKLKKYQRKFEDLDLKFLAKSLTS
jgi:hypothetical protein